MKLRRAMTKHNLVWLHLDDEQRLTDALRERFPGVRFINGSVWQSTRPPCVPFISDCDSGEAFIWNAQLYPRIKFVRWAGTFWVHAPAK